MTGGWLKVTEKWPKMDIDELINGLSASDLQEIEKSFGSESFSSFVDDR